MKRFALYLLVLFLAQIVHAQKASDKLDARLRFLMESTSGLAKVTTSTANVGQIPVLVKGPAGEVREKIEALNGIFHSAAGDISAANLSLKSVAQLAANPAVERIERAVKLHLTNDRAAEHIGARLVLHGEQPLQRPYTGKGVLIGIIDSGIDFRHMDFRTDAGRKSRILYLWDQGEEVAFPTGGVPYGKVWQQADIEADLTEIEPGRVLHLDKIGHGTHVSGTAGGNGNAVNQYRGMAPEAEFIVVALDFDTQEQTLSTRIIDALEFMGEIADRLQRPLVVNASLTTHDGTHDGASLLENAIENFVHAAPGRVFCAAAGNDGNAKIHWGANLEKDSTFTYLQELNQAFAFSGKSVLAISGRLASENLRDTFIGIAADSLVVGSGEMLTLAQGEWIAFDSLIKSGYWTKELITDAGQYLGSIALSASQRPDGICEFYMQISDSIYTDLYLDPEGNHLWGFDFWRVMVKGQGKIDYWLLRDWSIDETKIRLDNARYQSCDHKSTVGIPATGKNVIAVGSYTNVDQFINFHGNAIHYGVEPPEIGSLAYYSSRGPTADSRIKPEIVAPGHQVVSCRSSASFLSPVRNAILAPGKQHILSSGTSMACPVVTGAVALFLEKNPHSTIEDTRDALFKTCSSDRFTEETGVLPNSIWGYGKLDIFNAMSGVGRNIRANKSTGEFKLYQNFPNPFNPRTEILFELPVADIVDVDIFNIQGQKIVSLMHQQNMPRGQHSLNFDGREFASGVYFYQVRTSHFYDSGKMLLMR